MTKRLTTRGRATAEAIRDREEFTTSGALSGEVVDGRCYARGMLNETERVALDRDSGDAMIDYVVYSYATPIAWHTRDGRWHKIAQKFSTTTSKHQGNLYLID